MQRGTIVEDQRIAVINQPRHGIPVGTKGTIWQAHENPAGERVGRILWDNDVETPYFLERIPLDQIEVVPGDPPEWAAKRIAEWRRHTALVPKVQGPMANVLRAFKRLGPRGRKGKGGPHG